MTTEQVNADVAAFVRCGWPVHRALEVTKTANDNVTCFLPNNEARVRFSTRGNLHHETFHLVIERSASENRIEECAKEGMCDTYKFLKMGANGIATYDEVDRKWFERIRGFKDQTIKTILSSAGDKPHDMIHGIPASRILRQFDSLDKFRAQILLGFSAAEITDPKTNLAELLRFCWPLWKLMDGKTDHEKQPIKQQIEDKLSKLWAAGPAEPLNGL